MVIFDIKMCLQPGLCPDPDGRAYSTLPDPHTLHFGEGKQMQEMRIEDKDGNKKNGKGRKKQQRREAFPQCFLFYNEFNQWLYDIPQRVGVDADDWPATVLDV